MGHTQLKYSCKPFQNLESLLTKGTDYIDLNQFPDHAYYNEVSLSGERV